MGDSEKEHSDSPDSEGEDAGDELSEYDLLSSEASIQVPPQLNSTDLGATARAFNQRIQQKKKAQEVAVGQAEKATRHRHAMMIDALMHVRRSLREVTKIDLGERFRLALLADDSMGWPRLSLRLRDMDLPDQEYAQFTVSAHDRNATGTIEVISEGSGILERIMLAREVDAKRLPRTLKKCVRTYLDAVGEIILRSEREPDIEHHDNYIKKRTIDEFEEQQDGNEDQSISGDLFDEQQYQDNMLEVLPSLDELESLPEIGVGKKQPTH